MHCFMVFWNKLPTRIRLHTVVMLGATSSLNNRNHFQGQSNLYFTREHLQLKISLQTLMYYQIRNLCIMTFPKTYTFYMFPLILVRLGALLGRRHPKMRLVSLLSSMVKIFYLLILHVPLFNDHGMINFYKRMCGMCFFFFFSM